ncbi:hypothetical protein SARC_04404 [Sphaeroforma arctica JP610]|uniref:Uncharacterized protein n=1 Tax=Sphaeroforma arctica JP610 TaxID=667725 RepID=A0A0L0G2J4_9EUKA|nr:hypothetical protein SARC_04404 [Sphaeroforma arctica JP610]KNC83352.1 hypothetical protein SARC_04404 [Sphaeroforma arctica JP610]|eukprot:XP_014157254.1 hypothetical protein SARC_04404 [Sphaeroforma arctica JP610]
MWKPGFYTDRWISQELGANMVGNMPSTATGTTTSHHHDLAHQTIDSHMAKSLNSYEADLAKILTGFEAPAALNPFQETAQQSRSSTAYVQRIRDAAPVGNTAPLMHELSHPIGSDL